MPTGLPTSSPKKMPRVTGCTSSAATSSPTRRRLAFASANSGSTTKVVNGCSACSMRCNGEAMNAEHLPISYAWLCCTSSSSTCAAGSSADSMALSRSRLKFTKSSAGIFARVGIVNATSTPAIVACTPEFRKQNHTATPTSAYGNVASTFAPFSSTKTPSSAAPAASQASEIPRE